MCRVCRRHSAMRSIRRCSAEVTMALRLSRTAFMLAMPSRLRSTSVACPPAAMVVMRGSAKA